MSQNASFEASLFLGVNLTLNALHFIYSNTPKRLHHNFSLRHNLFYCPMMKKKRLRRKNYGAACRPPILEKEYFCLYELCETCTSI